MSDKNDTQDLTSSFYVELLTERQTDKHAHKRWVKQPSVGGNNTPDIRLWHYHCNKSFAILPLAHPIYVEQSQEATNPQTKPTILSRESVCRLLLSNPPSSFITTQPKGR